MLVEAGHDLHEIAGHVAIVELRFQDAVPGVLARTGRAGQHEDVSRIRDPAGRPRLHRGGADLVVGDTVKDLREAIHALFEQGFDRLRRHVAPREPRAAGGDDDVDGLIRDPALNDRANGRHVVGRDLAPRQRVARLLDACGQRRAGTLLAR